MDDSENKAWVYSRCFFSAKIFYGELWKAYRSQLNIIRSIPSNYQATWSSLKYPSLIFNIINFTFLMLDYVQDFMTFFISVCWILCIFACEIHSSFFQFIFTKHIVGPYNNRQCNYNVLITLNTFAITKLLYRACQTVIPSGINILYCERNAQSTVLTTDVQTFWSLVTIGYNRRSSLRLKAHYVLEYWKIPILIDPL